MKKLVIFLLLFLPSIGFAADVFCPAALVKKIQVQNHNVLVVQEGQGWHVVGSHSDASTDAKLSVLLAAQATGRKVQMRYPEGFVCSDTDYGTPSLAVRIYSGS